MGRRAKSTKVEPLLGDLTLNEESTLNQNGSIASSTTARTKKERNNTKRPRGPRANSKWVDNLFEDSTPSEDDTSEYSASDDDTSSYDPPCPKPPCPDHPQGIPRPRFRPTQPVIPEPAFPYFSLLPAELRVQIWDLVLASDPPPILRAHYDIEARQVPTDNPGYPYYKIRSGNMEGTWK